MNIKDTKQKYHTRKILIIAAALILAVGLIFATLEFLHVNNFTRQNSNTNTTDNGSQTININNDPATKEQVEAGSNTKNGSSSDTPSQPATIEGETKKVAQVTISAANQNDPYLQIRTIIGAVEASGTCSLSLISSSKTVTKTAPVQPLATTSTCQGFDVPLTELAKGNWQIKIVYSSNSLTGTATQDIVIK